MIIRQGIDSKALLVTLIRKLPLFLVAAMVGASFGSSLYCLIVFYQASKTMYEKETEYYIDFADGRLEAKDYYNDYTWNDVISTDLILGRMMEELGIHYNRAAVKQMINADILSDVRYLTITVKGRDMDEVFGVSTAFENAITEFGKSMDEFDAIYKIEDNHIRREQPVWFWWRAALLGAIIFVGIGVFLVLLAFMIGDRFYTKTDVMKYLGLTAVGLLYHSGNEKSGIQERRLVEALKALLENYQKIYLLDASDGRDARRFVKKLAELEADIDLDAFLPCERYHTGEASVILVIVPFERIYREKITDEINNAVTHGGIIAGAVLAECDKRWMKLYYGRKGVKA